MALRPLALFVVFALAAGALSGCVAKTAVTGDVRWTGENARASDGWSYNGEGVRLADGEVTLRVNDRSNRGEVKALVEDGFNTWRVEWTEFSGAKPFHDGGIVQDLVEHGASGTGDASIPEVHLLAAGWGSPRLYRNGEPVRDPATGAETLTGHFMVVNGALRGEDGVISNEDGTAPYSPDRAADGNVSEGGPHIFLQLRSRDPEGFHLVLEFRNARET